MASSILRKIRDILKLTESDNVYEAANAAARAKELIERYNITVEMLADKGATFSKDEIIDYHKVYKEPFKKSLVIWEKALIKIIAESNNCRVFLFDENLIECINIIGLSSDIEIVGEMFFHLRTQLMRLIFREAKKHDQEWIKIYSLGAITCINDKLIKTKEEIQKIFSEKFKDSTIAISRVNNRLSDVDNYLKSLNFDKQEIIIDNLDVFNKGIEDAKNIDINYASKKLKDEICECQT